MTGSHIWDALTEAVAAAAEPIDRPSVLSWLARHYPDINPSTASTYFNGAVEGSGNRGQFATHAPLMRKVDRGQFVRIDRQAHGPTVEAVAMTAPRSMPVTDSDESTYDIALVGCGRAKRDHPAAAADLYTSPGFAMRRALAGQRASSWFVLSPEHGLVAPHEWLAPYDLDLKDTAAAYQVAWGEWVTVRLSRKEGPLGGKRALVLAPAAYANAVRPSLRRAGCSTVEPFSGLTQGEQLQWLSQALSRA